MSVTEWSELDYSKLEVGVNGDKDLILRYMDEPLHLRTPRVRILKGLQKADNRSFALRTLEKKRANGESVDQAAIDSISASINADVIRDDLKNITYTIEIRTDTKEGAIVKLIFEEIQTQIADVLSKFSEKIWGRVRTIEMVLETCFNVVKPANQWNPERVKLKCPKGVKEGRVTCLTDFIAPSGRPIKPEELIDADVEMILIISFGNYHGGLTLKGKDWGISPQVDKAIVHMGARLTKQIDVAAIAQKEKGDSQMIEKWFKEKAIPIPEKKRFHDDDDDEESNDRAAKKQA